jgi:lipoic acid synthetase
MENKKAVFVPKPDWLKVPGNIGASNQAVMDLLSQLSLHTVCEEAHCPNCGECFGKKTATFMILGRNCTRNCTFCCVCKDKPSRPDPQEPSHIAQAVSALHLRYVVVTSVTRDDLPDGGALHFADVVHAVRASSPDTVIEVLIPDFQGERDALSAVEQAWPDVISHNIETIPRLYSEVRPMASYQRSLQLLGSIKSMNARRMTKSGIMLGLGETREEVLEVFLDLRKYQCDFLTIGQYLAPSSAHHAVVEYVHPEQFAWYREQALAAGFSYVASGPLVRSSYHAEECWEKGKKQNPD